jgi:hypothetical protein
VTAPAISRTSAARRIFRGYGPLVVFALLFLLMAAFVPTVDEQQVSAGAKSGSGTDGLFGPGSTTDSTAAGGDPAAGDPAATGDPAAAGADPAAAGGAAGGGAAGAAAGGGAGGAAGGGGAGGTSAAGVQKCSDRDKQIPGDPYSPPCLVFKGDNGGATAKGVTDKEIVVSARILDEKGFQQTLAALAGAEITDKPEDVKRTISAIADYLNKRMNFYGRQIKIVYYNGKGSSTNELLGGGQAEAEADAVTVAEEIKAFAEINGGTPPFSDALARKKVIAFGAPYLSREWMMKRRPYNWSVATDCSIISESGSEFAVKQLGGKNAEFAGPGLQGQPRKFALLAPENPWYQECVAAAKGIVKKAGQPEPMSIAYKLDINSMSNQAASVIAKLKSEGITTVTCGCDPIFPVFLTAKAQEQGYNPEWIVVGTAFTDIDLVGQLYQQDQWSRAFGVSYLGPTLPLRAGLGYAAYKTVRQDEPAFAVEAIYAQMYMLALGIHMAGPNLTPESYEGGMFNYPGGTGPFGTWGFDSDSYTPTQDYRVIWWDPKKTSGQNSKQGSYVESYGGKRFPAGKLPSEDPKVFGR